MIGTAVLVLLAALMGLGALGALGMAYYEERIARRKWGDVAWDAFVIALAVALFIGW